MLWVFTDFKFIQVVWGFVWFLIRNKLFIPVKTTRWIKTWIMNQNLKSKFIGFSSFCTCLAFFDLLKDTSADRQKCSDWWFSCGTECDNICKSGNCVLVLQILFGKYVVHNLEGKLNTLGRVLCMGRMLTLRSTLICSATIVTIAHGVSENLIIITLITWKVCLSHASLYT